MDAVQNACSQRIKQLLQSDDKQLQIHRIHACVASKLFLSFPTWKNLFFESKRFVQVMWKTFKVHFLCVAPERFLNYQKNFKENLARCVKNTFLINLVYLCLLVGKQPSLARYVLFQRILYVFVELSDMCLRHAFGCVLRHNPVSLLVSSRLRRWPRVDGMLHRFTAHLSMVCYTG